MKNVTKLLILLGCLAFTFSTSNIYAVDDFSFDLDAAINNVDKSGASDEVQETSEPQVKSIYNSVDAKSYLTETNNTFYHDALVESLIRKYKARNYVGCIQEAQSKINLESPNPVAMYYMALAYTQIGDVNAAIELYNEILKLNPSDTLSECVIRGRDCLTGGSACPKNGTEGADIDNAVQEYQSGTIIPNLPTGGASPVGEDEKKNTDNKKVISAESSIAEFVETEQPAKAEKEEVSKVPTNDEVLKAVKTLQAAGIAVTFQPGQLQTSSALSPEFSQLQMLMGSNPQQNNGLDMLPYMLMQSQNNNQYNPQMVQAMMMNYMMPNFNSDNKD